MSQIQKIPPQVPDRNQLGDRCYSYRNEVKGILGNVLESQHIQVTKEDVSISQWQKEKPGLVDWLAMVGGVAIVALLGWVIIQSVQGVLKSEIQNGNGNKVQTVDRYLG